MWCVFVNFLVNDSVSVPATGTLISVESIPAFP